MVEFNKKPDPGTFRSGSKHVERLHRVNGRIVQPKDVERPVEPAVPTIKTNAPSVAEDIGFYDLDDAPPSDSFTPPDRAGGTPPPPASETPDEDTILEQEVANPKADDFRRLREIAKKERKRNKEIAPELEILRTKISDYETGLAVPDRIAELEARVAEYEPSHHLYNLEANPVYRDTYVKPIEEAVGSLQELAKEYGVDNDTLNAAINAEKRTERNEVLSRAFKDELGAAEAKALIAKINDTRKAEAEARIKPADALKEMLRKKEIAEREEAAARVDSIIHASKSGWKNAITKIQTEQKYPHLVLGNDPSYNEVVMKIRQAASKSYGQLVTRLAELGIKELPEDLSEALSYGQTVMIGGMFAGESLAKLREENQKLKEQLGENNTYSRPRANGISQPDPVVASYGAQLSGPRATARRLLEGTQK